MDLSNKDQLLQYLKSHGLWAKKGLGQNFLVDKNALDKIVEAAEINDRDLVIEVGPGVGTLTEELINRSGEVIAVEMDERLAALIQNADLKNKNGNSKLKIICDDILKVNLNEIIGDRKYKVVANIPYYITSKILELFLSRENKPESIVLLVQKEVAERICAKAGAMSTLSVSVQLYGKPEIAGIVPASSFFPSPKVDSAILKVDRIQDTEYSKELEREFFRLVHIGFASRRKTLANNLSSGYHIDKTKALDIIKKAGFSENTRAQELSVLDWKKLAQKISH